jgi:hypothetical protein
MDMSGTWPHRISKILLLLILFSLSALAQRSQVIRVDTIRSYMNGNLTIRTMVRIVVDSAGLKHDTVAYLSDLTGGGGWKRVAGKLEPQYATDTVSFHYAELDSLKAALLRFGIAKGDSLQLVSPTGQVATITYQGSTNSNIKYPSPPTGSAGYVALRDTNDHIKVDSVRIPNPSNGTYVTIVNTTGTADTTLNILALGGGGNIGVSGVTVDETRTDSTLVDDAYLFASVAGTTDHAYAYGGIYAGYIDLLTETGGGYSQGGGVIFGFSLPDSEYSVLNVYVDYWAKEGLASTALRVQETMDGIVSGTKHYIIYQGALASHYSHIGRVVRINFYLDNRYGYSGNLKFQWARYGAQDGTETTLYAGTTMVTYRIQ